MEDEDIKIVEELIEDVFKCEDDELISLDIYIVIAIRRILSRLKTAERMNDVLAEHISERCHYIDDYSNSCDVIEDSCYENKDCKECIKEWARKKVEE